MSKQRKLTVSKETFNTMLRGIIISGVTFESIELENGQIEIIFTGGY